ncbi:cytochrome P450 [Enhygromyxa salina]|uniref:Putative cytochrome P450 n=1 Tax=Enhygromyxa salina TaxID=215803 RepID=A0A2S9XQT2_9BACT|nr:cytochrome P450 [Enhygromyxa salina]PRP95224.1 putative cytochrome P450 [Enhygromyxa salina]
MSKPARDAPKLPGRWPILGNIPRFSRDAVGLLRDAQNQLGPVFWIDLGFGNNAFIVMSDEGFTLLKNKDTNSSHLREFPILGSSMLTVDGPQHRRMRGASSSAFTPAGLSRASVGELIAQTLEGRIATWRGRDRVPIVQEAKVIALEVIFRIMGVDVDDLPYWSRWYTEFLYGAINIKLMFPGSPAWRARRGRRRLEVKMLEIIAQARAQGDRDSLVGAMAHGKDDDGAGMSEQELIDNLLVLGLAGHETTASTMAWSMFHLASSASAWTRLVDEAQALAELPRDPTEMAQVAPFALAVFRESLRLYPPVVIDSRLAHERFELEGYVIEPDMVVATSLLHLSRDPQRYPDPDDWQPQRWLDHDRKPTALENCQFGGGPHFCLGYHVALLEGAMFLVHVARTLSNWGVRPQPLGSIPKATFLPLTQPPGKAQIRLG